jgi:hypothetical protein
VEHHREPLGAVGACRRRAATTRVFDLKVDDSGRFHGTDGIDGTGENSFDANATYRRDFSLAYARASMGRPVA